MTSFKFLIVFFVRFKIVSMEIKSFSTRGKKENGPESRGKGKGGMKEDKIGLVKLFILIFL